jgi:peptide/nickel transport system permease protein
MQTTVQPTIALPQSESRFFIFLKAFRKSRTGVFGFWMIVIVVIIAIFAPVIAPYEQRASASTIESIYQPPSAQHWFGTDDAGQDVFSNFVYGARVSLIVGIFAALIAVLIGGSFGLIAGFFGGRLETSLMRFTDIMLVIPDLPLIVVIVALTKPSLFNIIFVIGLLGWTTTARVVRSQTLAVKSRKFVLRARAIGAGKAHIIYRHILPLVMPILVVQAVLVISLAILNESALSFIGLGDPTTLSWGQMLNFAFGRGATSTGAWWALVFPGIGIVWLVLGLTLLGQGLEQVLNPRLDTHHLMPSRLPLSKEALVKPLHQDTLFEVQNLSIHYVAEGKAPAHAVEDVSFTLKKGELLGLVGESGCGKTTLMLSLLRLLPSAGQIVNGKVFFKGKDLTSLSEEELNEIRWRGISIVFQGAMNALNPVRTVGEQISEAVLKHEPKFPKDKIPARVTQLLELVGITTDQRDHFPHQYSGGMRQRAMIAMALACNPDVIIADEPTTALDVMIQAQILELLDSLRKKLGLAVIFVTHDLGIVAELCDKVLVMYGGVTAEYADVDTIYNDPKHPYTQELLKAFPDLTKPKKKLSSIPGYPPRLDALPAGCRFAPRCPAAFDRCHTEQPALHSIGNNNHIASCHLVEASK